MCRGTFSLPSKSYDMHTENCTCLKFASWAQKISNCESCRLTRSLVLRVAVPAGWGTRISRCRTDITSYNFFIYEGYLVINKSHLFIESFWACRRLFKQDSKYIYVPTSVWCKKLEISKAFFRVWHVVNESVYSGWYREENVQCTSFILVLITIASCGMSQWMKAFYEMKLLRLLGR